MGEREAAAPVGGWRATLEIGRVCSERAMLSNFSDDTLKRLPTIFSFVTDAPGERCIDRCDWIGWFIPRGRLFLYANRASRFKRNDRRNNRDWDARNVSINFNWSIQKSVLFLKPIQKIVSFLYYKCFLTLLSSKNTYSTSFWHVTLRT